eukprot:TRINITY_DN3257_c0_g1_i3.p1 TRINITY_DN3257_c0_g1~~TRINITY_DN3257_c0_g1_i3.p1  ORF type:complete len:158 (-),score=39.23 TRINITY_DN3257_c0_g1_i3:119-544(-)
MCIRDRRRVHGKNLYSEKYRLLLRLYIILRTFFGALICFFWFFIFVVSGESLLSTDGIALIYFSAVFFSGIILEPFKDEVISSGKQQTMLGIPNGQAFTIVLHTSQGFQQNSQPIILYQSSHPNLNQPIHGSPLLMPLQQQ